MTTMEKMIKYYIEHNKEYFFKEVVNFYIENNMIEVDETLKEYFMNAIEENKMIKYYIEHNKEYFYKEVVDFYIENNKNEFLLNMITLIVNVGTVYGIYRIIKKFF